MWLKRGKWATKYKHFCPWNVRQTEQEGGGRGEGAAEGRECKPWIARKELVGDWDPCVKKIYTVVFLVWELKAVIRINTRVFRWRSSLLLNDFQDSYVISRGVILGSVQVNSSAILIQPGVVKNILCRPYEYHYESLIVRIIFSY